MSLSSFDTDITANKIKQTYVRGFIDISGGDLNVQTGNINVFSGEMMPVFRVVGDHFVIKDRNTSNYVDVSLDKLIQLNSITSNVDQDISSIKQRITAVSYLDGNTYLADGLNVSGGAVFTSGLNVSGGAAVFTNAVSFAARWPTWDGAVGDPSLNNQFVTKGYADVNGGTILLGAGRENTWYSNNFVHGNTVFPVVPPRFDGNTALFIGNSLVTKSYVDSNGGTSLLGTQNLFTQKNSFQVDVSMGQSLIVYGDISLNGSLRVGGSVATNATALNFDCGGPYTNYTFSTKFDAGGI